MSEAPTLVQPVDRTLFSLHPEDEMTERVFHDNQLEYFKFALPLLLPGWFVARNLAVYWVPGQYQHPYAGPDLLVSRGRPAGENPSCYVTWEDGPLTLVVEVASEKTRHLEPKRRDETYAQVLQVPEHLLIDFERDELVLSRLVEGRYEPVTPDEQGRVWSRELGLGFVWQEDGRLARVVQADGSIVPTGQEAEALRRAAEERAEQEARRAQREARRADEAERRAEALAAELERLRRALQERQDPSGQP